MAQRQLALEVAAQRELALLDAGVLYGHVLRQRGQEPSVQDRLAHTFVVSLATPLRV